MKYVLNQQGETGEEALARQAFIPGLKLYGYCCGIFGRDSYDAKTIKQVTEHQIICINENGHWITGELREGVHSWVEILEASNSFLKYEINGEEYK